MAGNKEKTNEPIFNLGVTKLKRNVASRTLELGVRAGKAVAEASMRAGERTPQYAYVASKQTLSGFKRGQALRIKENVPISDQQFRATRGLRVTYNGHVFN